MNYYKRWIGDYQRDTGHLSMVEHGAYNLMLDVHYATERPLPRDKEALYRLLRAITKEERAAVESVLGQFWTETDDGWVNGRANEEITKAGTQAETNRRIAAEREAKRREHEQSTKRSTNRATNRDTNRSTIAQRTHSHSLSHSLSHSHSQKKEKDPSADPPTKSRTNSPAKSRPDARPPPPEWEHLKSLYPERAGAQPWTRALRATNARIKEGATWEELIDGVSRYAVYCRETGKVGTEFVMQAATFLGPECHFRQPWQPPPTESEQRLRDNIAAAERAMEVLAERDGLEVSHD